MATLSVPMTSVVANKVPNTLPHQYPNKPLDLTEDAKANPSLTPLQQGNQNVLQAAQQKVLGGMASPVMQTTSQKTQQLLQDPNAGFDFSKINKQNMEQFDINRANTMEATRQGLADTMNTGSSQNRLLQLALQSGTDRTLLQRQNEIETAEKARQNLLGALDQGRQTAGAENARYQSDVGGLQAVSGMAEGMENRAADMQKLTVSFGQDMAKMIAQNDWQGAQNSLDRELKQVMQSNDINATSASIQKQLDFDRWKQENGQTFTAEQNSLNRALELSLKDKDLDSQKALMELKGKIDAGMLTKEQDFEAAQSAIDRSLQKALQEGDIQGQLKAIQAKGELDKQAQEAQQKWQSAERTATQGWQTNERLDEQSFKSAQSYLDRTLQETLQTNELNVQKELEREKNRLEIQMQSMGFAQEQRMAYLNDNLAQKERDLRLQMQGNEIEAQKYIEKEKRMLAIQMQSQGFAQDQRMKYLDDRLAEARATNDVQRQKDLIEFQTTQELTKIETEQSFQAKRDALNYQLQMALKKGDMIQQEMLQRKQLEFQREELDKQDEWKKVELGLQGKQIDLQGKQYDYNMLMEGVKAGTIDATSAQAAIRGAMRQYGISVQPPNPNASRMAIAKQYDDMRYQFGLTNPTLVDSKGNLTQDGQNAFNNFVNKTTPGAAQIVQGIDASGAPVQVTVDLVVDSSPMNKDGINLGATPAYWDASSNSWTPIRDSQVVTFGANMSNNDGMGVPKGTYRLETISLRPTYNADVKVYTDVKSGAKYLAQKSGISQTSIRQLVPGFVAQ